MSKKQTSGLNQVYILKLNDDLRQKLQSLAGDWEQWVRTHHDAEEVALQLAAYQSLAQKRVDKIVTISEKLQILEDQVEQWEDNDPNMEI